MAKLCDFGVSEKLSSPDEQLTKSAGTFHFFAPECCDPDVSAHNGQAADVWALGVTMFALLFNTVPFWDENAVNNEHLILDVIL